MGIRDLIGFNYNCEVVIIFALFIQYLVLTAEHS